MTSIALQITISAAKSEAVDESGKHNWLNVKQAKIPEDQKIATLNDVGMMLTKLQSGRSAYTAIKSCPVRKSQASGAWKASYTAEVEVHHAEGLEYELEITKDGELLEAQGPGLAFDLRSESFDVDYNQTQQIGFLAADGSFSGTWEGAVYDEQGDSIAIKPDITHDDGFAYIDEPVFGTFRASGTAKFDRWRAEIEHQLGSKWSSSLWAVAWWPAGIERKYQKSFECEIKLPQCVIDAMNECASDGSGDGSGDGDGGDDSGGGSVGKGGYWTYQLNPPRTAILNKCKKEVIEITYDSK